MYCKALIELKFSSIISFYIISHLDLDRDIVTEFIKLSDYLLLFCLKLKDLTNKSLQVVFKVANIYYNLYIFNMFNCIESGGR